MMIKVLFSLLLLAHALIHLMGFLKAYRLAELPQLTQTISKPAGAAWLATAHLFLAALAALLLGRDWWWIVALPAMIMSQALIISQWHDAKFGTIANVIVLTALMIAYGTWKFNTMARTELKTFLGGRPLSGTIVTMEKIAGLPPVVQRWLVRSNCVGKEMVHTVHLMQKGAMRTTPDGAWMPVDAEQWFTADRPGLFWIADVKAAPGIHLSGRDKYENGHGHMLIRALALVPVADAKGATIDQGTMLRYLAEIGWFPSAALSDCIRWEQIAPDKALATMTYGGLRASGIFTFTPEGDMESFEAKRYFDRKNGATLETWFIQNDPDSYKEFNGIRIGTRSAVTWKLREGDYTWFKLEVADVAYNGQAAALGNRLLMLD